MRNLIRSLAAAVLSLAMLTTSTLAAFQPIREVQAFSDVPASHWSHDYVSQCYALGLMSGTGGSSFSPSAQLQVSEAVSISVRLRDLYQGGDGVLDQSGENWYDGAVEQALAWGILTEGQFDRYDRPATRAELAGLLARALPQEAYAAINQITSLPDVSASTPYAQEIFTLYNAGILTGSDSYGTFTPSQPITRAEVCALVCRLALPETRMSLTLAEKPVDVTVRATDRKLYVGGVPVLGVVQINGTYYIPVEALDDRNALPNFGFSYQEDNGTAHVSFAKYWYDTPIPVLSYAAAPPSGHVMGTAALSPLTLSVNGSTHTGAIYTLGGRYPMLSLEALGAVSDGYDFRLAVEGTQNLTAEADLAGSAMSGLYRASDRDTVTAIHNYLVNTLTYSPWVSAPSSMSYEAREAAAMAYDQVAGQYHQNNNVTLASRYGVCQDYAELFRTMCIRAGIPCILVTGMGNGGSHAWNMVYVDGQWLYVDCTFDDPISSTPTLRQTYCMVGPEVMVLSHYWEGTDYPMPAEYDPAWANLDPNNITSADMFRKCLVAQLMQRKTDIRLRTVASGAYGGVGCIYAYDIFWWSFYGGYDQSTGTYHYFVEY